MTMTAALLGAGTIGDAHLQAIADLDGIAAVGAADINAERIKQTEARFGVKSFTDYRKMIDEVRPDIAIIALPHFLHKEAAVYCASRGCHLLLEKPMALTASECDEIVAAADRAGVVVFVGHTQQFLSYNLAAKALISNTELGKLVMIGESRHGLYFTPDRPAWFLNPALSGGGIVANLGAHAIDKLQWLTDSRIAKVRATLSYEAEQYPDTEGSAAMLLTTSEGVPCTVNLSGYAGAPGEVTELVFTNGMIRIVNHQSLWLSRGGDYEEVAVEQVVDPLRLQLIELASCIREDRQPYCSGEYGSSVVKVIEAVYASHKKGEEIEL